MTNKIPKFETTRLFLREVLLSDATNYQKHFAHWEIIKNLRHTVPYPYPKEGAREYIQSVLSQPGIWIWGIFLKENKHELIGAISLYRTGMPGNRGFWLAQEHWGKGLMTEAICPVLDYAFMKLGFEKMILDNAVKNKASRRIKEKTNCRYLYTRDQKFANPEWTKGEIWELTKENWLKFRCSSDFLHTRNKKDSQ